MKINVNHLEIDEEGEVKLPKMKKKKILKKHRDKLEPKEKK